MKGRGFDPHRPYQIPQCIYAMMGRRKSSRVRGVTFVTAWRRSAKRESFFLVRPGRSESRHVRDATDALTAEIEKAWKL